MWDEDAERHRFLPSNTVYLASFACNVVAWKENSATAPET
jgi:hypothetical protein